MTEHPSMPSPSCIRAHENKDLQGSTVRKSAQIPTDRIKFKAWADRECWAWPADLQAKAYRAWLEFNLETDALETFRNFYDAFRRGK